MTDSVFSETLQSLRKSKGLTQGQLAEQLGVSAQAVSKWENGSYPDGDLIPKIADIFGVSVSALYGRGSEQAGIQQQVLDALQQAESDDSRTEILLEILWAVQLSHWPDNHHYFSRTASSDDSDLSSVFLGEDYLSYMSLKPHEEFFAVVREPAEGFSTDFEHFGQLISLFRVLSEPGCMKVLLFLMTLKDREYAGIGTIAARTGLGQLQSKSCLEQLCTGPAPLNCIRSVEILNAEGTHEQAYGIRRETAGLLPAVFAQLNALLSAADRWALNISRRDRGLLTPQSDPSKGGAK